MTEERQAEISGSSGRNRGLLVVLVVFSLIVGGAVGWTIRGTTDPATNSGESEAVGDLVDTFFSAFNEYDSDGMDALLADDYVFQEVVLDPLIPVPLEGVDTRGEIMGRLDALYPGKGVQKEPIGEPTITGEGPWVVAQQTLFTSDSDFTDVEGVTTLVIVEDGDQLKVRMERLVGLVPGPED